LPDSLQRSKWAPGVLGSCESTPGLALAHVNRDTARRRLVGIAGAAGTQPGVRPGGKVWYRRAELSTHHPGRSDASACASSAPIRDLRSSSRWWRSRIALLRSASGMTGESFGSPVW